MLKFFVILIFFFSTFSQSKLFDIVKYDEIIGSLKVSKRVDIDTTTYVLKAKMTFDYLFMSHDYSQKAVWKITKNDFSYRMNSSISGNETSVRINKQNEYYHFIRDSFLSSDEFSFKEKPKDLFVELYFSKPKTNNIFSANFGKVYPLIKTNKSYFYETDKNNWTVFYNDNASFKEALFDGFITYKLVDNSNSN